jgi:hypothetical protein
MNYTQSIFTTTNRVLEASWSGFTDAQSGINGYMVQFFQQVWLRTEVLMLHNTHIQCHASGHVVVLWCHHMGTPGPVHACLPVHNLVANSSTCHPPPSFLLQAANRSLPSFNVTPAMDAGLLTQVSVAVNTTAGRAYFARVRSVLQPCHTVDVSNGSGAAAKNVSARCAHAFMCHHFTSLTARKLTDDALQVTAMNGAGLRSSVNGIPIRVRINK